MGLKNTPDQIEKQAAKLRGKKKSPEAIAAMVKAITGRKLSPEHAAKSRATLALHRGAMRGKSHSAETKARMVAVNKAKVEYGTKHSCDRRYVTLVQLRADGFCLIDMQSLEVALTTVWHCKSVSLLGLVKSEVVVALDWIMMNEVHAEITSLRRWRLR